MRIMPDTVDELLPDHRDRAWRNRRGGTWSWDAGRQQWLDESRGEADIDAWHPQESMSRLARWDAPYTALG
jgi:hypothetical protein